MAGSLVLGPAGAAVCGACGVLPRGAAGLAGGLGRAPWGLWARARGGKARGGESGGKSASQGLSPSLDSSEVSNEEREPAVPIDPCKEYRRAHI